MNIVLLIPLIGLWGVWHDPELWDWELEIVDVGLRLTVCVCVCVCV